jgi:hypothetical protein
MRQMGRLITMARFAEPDEPKVAGHCCHCSEELYEGDTVVKWEFETFCNITCFVEYMDITEEEL